ncbi:MAG TPA: hemerythrin domain-containing protein [Candidatus Binatia bacterium]|jgi:hemerythrin superfamily protein
MDALDLLVKDHKTLKKLFKHAKKARDVKTQKRIVAQMDTELSIHDYIEETVFYPEMEQYEELKEIVEEALEEHEAIKTLLVEMAPLAGSVDFDSSLQELIENVETHIEEEETELFPKIRELWDETTLEQLGDRLELAKEEQQLQAG